MPATNYKVFQWGNPVGKGATKPYHVAVSGIAKTAIAGMPRTVANELICADLARALRLPVPPSFLVEKEGLPYHVSLNFYLAGESLPDVDAAAVVAAQPELCGGIVLFDTWICNGDRNAGNISFDSATNQVMIFDHSHAFMSGDQWRNVLENQQLNPTFTGSPLAPHLDDTVAFKTWHEKVRTVPEYYVREAVKSGADSGMSQDDVRFVADFLLDRREKLYRVLNAAKGQFPKIPDDKW